MGFTLVYLTTYTFNYSFYNPPTGPASHSTRGIVKQLVYNKYSNVFYFVKKIISIAYNYTIMLAINFAASGAEERRTSLEKKTVNAVSPEEGPSTTADRLPTDWQQGALNPRHPGSKSTTPDHSAISAKRLEPIKQNFRS